MSLGAEESIRRTPSLADYFAAVRYRARQIVAIALLLTLVVAVFSVIAGSGKATYQGSADVLLEVTEEEGADFSPATQARILASLPVAERVARGLDGEVSARALLERTIVTPIPESNILTVTTEADEPETAATIANLFVKEFLAVSAQQARIELETRLDSIRSQITFTQRRLDRILQQRESSRVQRDLVSRELERLRAQAHVVGQQLRGELRPGRAVAPATPAQTPIAQALGPILLAVAAGVTGALLMLAFVLLQEHFSDRIRSRSDVISLLGAPVLATLRSPVDSESDELRLLSSDLHHVMVRNAMHALLLTRVPAEIETTILVSRVAAHLAEADRKVVIVEGTAKPSPPIVSGNGSEIGNESADRSPASDSDRVATERLPRPLTPPAAEKLLAELETEWDTVLIDGPAATSADASILGTGVDGMVLIVGAEQISQTQLARAREHLTRTDTPLLGAVLVSSPRGIPLREH